MNSKNGNMKINDEGLDLIKRFEEFRAEVYLDAAGFSTIGYGHLIKPGESFTKLSEEEALELLKQDVGIAEQGVIECVEVTLTSNQFSALVSLTFNIGNTAFKNSTLCSILNKEDYLRSPGEIMRWYIAGGRALRGLIRRRAVEAELFIT